MLPELGHFCLILAMLLALLPLPAAVAARATVIAAALCAVAVFALCWSALVSDFTLALVAERSHTLLPWPRRIGAVMLSVPGLAVIAAMLIAAAVQRLPPSPGRRVLSAGNGLLIAAVLLTLHPFARFDPPPFDGRGFEPFAQEQADP